MLWATIISTPAAFAASTRLRVPSMRRRVFAARSSALRSVSSCMIASGASAATASAKAAASYASTTPGRAPAAATCSARSGRRVVPHTSWPAWTSRGSSWRPITPVAPATKIRICPSRLENRSYRFGRLAGQPVAGVGDEDELGVRKAPDEPLRGDGDVLAVPLAREHRGGHRDLRQAMPERRHGAGAEAAQDGGQCARVVAQEVLAPDPLRLGRRGGEERLRGPAVCELLDRRGLGEGREPLVGLAAGGAPAPVRGGPGGWSRPTGPARRP